MVSSVNLNALNSPRMLIHIDTVSKCLIQAGRNITCTKPQSVSMKLKEIERLLSSVVYDFQIYRKFGTRNPESVTLPGTQQKLHLDPRDYRARKMIIMNCCVRNSVPRNQRFWRMAVDELQPTTALDVGLNFGECMLSTTYPVTTALFAFEANVKLKPFIDKSLAAHPNRKQIECLYQLATDQEEESEFWVKDNWSGGSTAAAPDANSDPGSYRKTTVTSTRVDTVLQRNRANTDTLFFKIDVEGYEYRVLLGMLQTIATSQNAVGFIEFDPVLLKRAGEDVSAFWSFLKQNFRMFAFGAHDCWHDCNTFGPEEMATTYGPGFHTDLLLVKSDTPDEIVTRLRQRWTNSDRSSLGLAKSA